MEIDSLNVPDNVLKSANELLVWMRQNRIIEFHGLADGNEIRKINLELLNAIISDKNKLIEVYAQDWADDDTDIRNACMKVLPIAWVEGDKWGVPPMASVVERVVEEFLKMKKEKEFGIDME